MPGAGFPRGKLSVWAPHGGVGAVLRATCRAVATGGERTAWIDASRTLTFGWGEETPIIVQSADRLDALRCAEILLRCGAFGLVVLEGTEPQGTETVRLTRAARDGGGALVAITELTSMAALRISSRMNVHGVRWRPGPFGDPAIPVDVRVDVRVRSLGWNARAELVLPIAVYDLRCVVESGPDRRNSG